MTKSTFPDAWLQALATEKVAKLNQEAMKDFVMVEKKVFDTLQKKQSVFDRRTRRNKITAEQSPSCSGQDL